MTVSSIFEISQGEKFCHLQHTESEKWRNIFPFYLSVWFVCILNQKYKRQREKGRKSICKQRDLYFIVKPCVSVGGGGRPSPAPLWFVNARLKHAHICTCVKVWVFLSVGNCANAYVVMHMCVCVCVCLCVIFVWQLRQWQYLSHSASVTDPLSATT